MLQFACIGQLARHAKASADHVADAFGVDLVGFSVILCVPSLIVHPRMNALYGEGSEHIMRGMLGVDEDRQGVGIVIGALLQRVIFFERSRAPCISGSSAAMSFGLPSGMTACPSNGLPVVWLMS